MLRDMAYRDKGQASQGLETLLRETRELAKIEGKVCSGRGVGNFEAVRSVLSKRFQVLDVLSDLGPQAAVGTDNSEAAVKVNA